MSVTAAMNISLDAPWQSDKVKKKEMKDDIIGDTSGNFQKLCLLLAKC